MLPILKEALRWTGRVRLITASWRLEMSATLTARRVEPLEAR